jgi:WhiB family redox-sensing transcriptional regulator
VRHTFQPSPLWMTKAKCHGKGDLFYAQSDFGERDGINHSQRKALSICFGCPVRQKCLQYALEHKEPWGVWGGTLEAWRHKRGLESLRELYESSYQRAVSMGLAGRRAS